MRTHSVVRLSLQRQWFGLNVCGLMYGDRRMHSAKNRRNVCWAMVLVVGILLVVASVFTLVITSPEFQVFSI